MKLPMFELAGDLAILAGAVPGKNLLARMIAEIQRRAEPTPLFLDFTGVEVATNSFLRESIIGIRDYCRSANTNLYPVIANANDIVVEELRTLLEDHGEAMITCQLDEQGNASNATVVGVLEEKQAITLEAVKTLKRADAQALREKFKRTDKIGITGWNNRLASLAEKGLLMALKKGRVKYYQPVLELQ
jgi:antitoxin component HigA of HigAB toxin-antitoxin module